MADTIVYGGGMSYECKTAHCLNNNKQALYLE